MELVLPFWSLSGDFASKTTQRCRGGNKGGSVCPCQRKTQLAGSPTRAGSEACWAREQVDSERYAGQATGMWRTSWPDPLSRVVAHKWTRQTWSPPGAPTRAACVHKTHSETSTTLGCKLSNHYTVSTISKTLWFCISQMIIIYLIGHCFDYSECPITRGVYKSKYWFKKISHKVVWCKILGEFIYGPNRFNRFQLAAILNIQRTKYIERIIIF